MAVTAVSVVTGISVALHDYDFKFNSLQISSNELIYDLIIVDNKKSEEESNYEEIDYQHYEEDESESGDFLLRVYNADYDYTNPLWLGSNYGSFIGLNLGETYNIVLSENRYGGETLFKEMFTTAELSKFSVFEIYPDANFVTNTISVYLDYLDEADTLSDFTLTLSNETQPDGMSFSLEKKNGIQEVVLIDSDSERFDLTEPCHYDFSYKNNGEEVVFKSGEISFYNIAPEKSEFYQFIFDGSANYITEEFYVQLNYVDDLNLFSEFTLRLSDETTGFDIDIPLEKTTDQQTIDSQLYDIGFSNTYTYQLFCMQEDDSAELASGSVTFYDISGGVSEFNSITIDEGADFLNKTFNVQLYYQDDFDYYYDFRLIFDEDNASASPNVFSLEKTTETQTIDCSASDFDFRVEHNYVLKCYNMGVEEILASGDVMFFDTSGAVSEFNGLIFDKKADFVTRKFDIALDYQDDFDYFSDFMLTIYDDTKKESVVFSLDKTKDVQTFAVDEKNDAGSIYESYVVDIVADDLTYSFTYRNEGELVEYILDEELVFENSNPSTFSGIESPYIFLEDVASNDGYYVPMRLIMNDTMEIYNGLTIELLSDDVAIGAFTMNIEVYDDSWNYAYFTTYDSQTIDDILSSNGLKKIRVTGSVYDERTHSTLTDKVLYEEEITLQGENVDELYGVKLDGMIMLGSHETSIMPVFSGDPLNVPCEIIFETQTGKTYTYDLYSAMYNQFATIEMASPKEGNYEEDTFYSDFSEPVKVSIKYKILYYSFDPATSSEPLYIGESEEKTIVCYDSFQFELAA